MYVEGKFTIRQNIDWLFVTLLSVENVKGHVKAESHVYNPPILVH